MFSLEAHVTEESSQETDSSLESLEHSNELLTAESPLINSDVNLTERSDHPELQVNESQCGNQVDEEATIICPKFTFKRKPIADSKFTAEKSPSSFSEDHFISPLEPKQSPYEQ